MIVMNQHPSSKFSLRARLRSICFAWAGIVAFFKAEPNACIHAGASMAAVALGFSLQLSAVEWIVISLSISLVWAAELFNTAIERMANRLSPGYDPAVKFVKDVAAAAVLLTALGAFVSGIIIFLPKIINYVS